MACVVQGIAGRENGLFHQLRHGLNAQTAGDDENALGPLGDKIPELSFRLGPVAQEIDLDRTGDGLALFLGELDKRFAVGLLDGCEFPEALVTGYNEDVVRSGQKRCKLFGAFQPVLGIVLQFLTFLT